MLQPLTGDADSHAKCRFPARLIWLREHFPEYREALSDIDCPALAAWVNIQEVESVSLVFANGYLGNPASYYGHIFLKFNNRRGKTSSHLIDQTVNYGAIDTSRDDPLSYIVKGVAGGYDGGFSPADFFFHDANYGENELRDLWEYRLALTPEEIRYITAHAWEVMHQRYVYYFFHDNCAFRVAELLEIVADVKANPLHRPWLVPQAVLQQVSRSIHRGRPLVAKRIFHPSRQSRLHARFAGLNAEQRSLVSGIVQQQLHFDGPEMQRLPLVEKFAVIDTVLDYHRFSKGRREQDGEENLSPAYVAALAARFALPPGEAASAAQEPVPPDLANSPSWVQVGVSHRPNMGTNGSLRIRPAYYDALDVSGAQAKNGGLSMGELFLQADEHRLRVVRFDMLAIESMNPAVSGLPGDRGVGWRLKAGLDQDRLACTDCLLARAQGDYTLGRYIDAAHQVVGVLNLGGALQARGERDGIGFARFGVSLIARPSPELGLRFSHEFRRGFEANASSYTVSAGEARLALSKDYDLRVLWERDQTSRISVGLGRYW